MRYKARTGVVLTSICGSYFLVCAKSLLPECPYVVSINETSAFLWKQLIQGASAEELEAAVSREYEADDPDEIKEAIASFMEQMRSMHYLQETEGEQQ